MPPRYFITVATRLGFALKTMWSEQEPGTISSKSTVLNAVLNGQAKTERCGLVVRLFRDFNPPSGSAGRIRTYDQPINSRLLYH